MTLNPQSQSRKDAVDATRNATISAGYITDVQPNDGMIVSVQPVGQQIEIPMLCPIWANGDFHVPHRDAPLKVYYIDQNGTYPIIVSFGYSSTDDIPQYQTGERRISHTQTDTNIYFKKNGTITISTESGAEVAIKSDGAVQINGGTKGAIHDITTTKDGDGHITDITLERRSDILL